MKRTLITTLTAIIFSLSSLPAAAHCQIPCGIYNDMMRVVMMQEHITTIEKSMTLIGELAGKTGAGDVNQLVRWIDNKDQHADLLSDIATEYFLKQRIKKPAAGDEEAVAKYGKQLEVLHGILVTSMKAKQTVDAELVATLRALVDSLAELYFSEEQLEHMQAHH